MIFFLFFLSIVKDLLLDLRNSMFMKAQFVSPLYNVDILQLLGIKRYNRRKEKGSENESEICRPPCSPDTCERRVAGRRTGRRSFRLLCSPEKNLSQAKGSTSQSCPSEEPKVGQKWPSSSTAAVPGDRVSSARH